MFLSRLVISGPYAGRRWVVERALIYRGKDEVLAVPRDQITDGASIPRIFWPLVGHPLGRHARAAVLHDYLYRNRVVSRKDADGIFRRCMKQDGVGLMRWPMYWAVRAFGWLAYPKG